ncbi:nuclear transport factor 2 family protein [Pseudomonas sp. NPDC089734]|uniref:nuclear transport factor 2 family protein n=1 Tax=Pseudomonas sp. NPDC089734 TaxID=3364469 RepID=UPI003816FF64
MSAQKTDQEYVEQAVGNYVSGMVFADEALLRRTFHPDCRIVGHYNGALEWLSLDDFIDAIKTEGPASEGYSPFWEIQNLDITGDSAAVKVRDHYIGLQFTDYLSLLKVYADWVIVHKLYYAHD